MKKAILLLSVMFFTISVFSQDPLVNKKGETLLPKAGDIAIGVDAGPFLSYMGNFLNGSANNVNPNMNFLNGTTLFGKYFLEDKAVVRIRFEFTNTRTLTRQYVRDDNAYYLDPLSREQVVDEQTLKNSNYILGVEYELRRGRGRLQGFYGGGVLFRSGNSTAKYVYGNPYSQVYPDPTDYDFGTNLFANGDRVLKLYNGRTLGVGLNAFVGVEYFFMPNMSLGGELGWRLLCSKSGQAKYTYETWDVAAELENTQLVSPGNNTFTTATVNPSTFNAVPTAGIFLLFHF